MLSFCWSCLFQALLLLIVANGAPVLTNKLLGKKLARPIDSGLKLTDGYRLLGNSKTWRGLFSAILLTTVVAALLGLEPLIGVLFATLTMTGDLLASFIKRRLGKVDSSRARGLDTVPESLLPLWVLNASLGLSVVDILLAVGIFFLCEEFISPILYKLHLRNRPH